MSSLVSLTSVLTQAAHDPVCGLVMKSGESMSSRSSPANYPSRPPHYSSQGMRDKLDSAWPGETWYLAVVFAPLVQNRVVVGVGWLGYQRRQPRHGVVLLLQVVRGSSSGILLRLILHRGMSGMSVSLAVYAVYLLGCIWSDFPLFTPIMGKV